MGSSNSTENKQAADYWTIKEEVALWLSAECQKRGAQEAVEGSIIDPSDLETTLQNLSDDLNGEKTQTAMLNGDPVVTQAITARAAIARCLYASENRKKMPGSALLGPALSPSSRGDSLNNTAGTASGSTGSTLR
jgi:hypothetical protein